MDEDNRFPPIYPTGRFAKDTLSLNRFARYKRDSLLETASAFLTRHLNQAYFGIRTSLNDKEIKAVAQFAQRLRDVPAQKGFPLTIEWPKVPKCLSSQIISLTNLNIVWAFNYFFN